MNAPNEVNEQVANVIGGLFVTVPEITLPNGVVVPSFKVGQYACSKDEEGKATVSATLKPWVSINYHDSRQACLDVGANLITELQYLAIAHDVAQQDINWTGGKVGEGKLFQGLRKYSVNEAQAGDYEPTDPDERRWMQLSNGERIYDIAGNVYSWVFDNVQGDENGIVAKAFAKDSPSITTAPFPSYKKGMGWYPQFDEDDEEIDWSGRALVRGGCVRSSADAGAFYLRGVWPVVGYDLVGFRCTK